MTDEQAFKVGFLARCAHDRLGPVQTQASVRAAHRLLEKYALLDKVWDLGKGLVGHGLDAGKSIAEHTLGYGVPLALAAPPVLGGLAGYGLARATDIDDTDVDDVRDREVSDEYRRQTAALLRRRAVRDYTQARRRTGRVFG